MKIAIVTDSTAYLPLSVRQEHHVYMLPLLVQLNGSSYREEVDLSASEFYELLRNSSQFPSSSQPIIGETHQLFARLAQDYDAIISIHLSSGISGAYQSVYTLKDEFPLCQVYPYDSEVTCYAQGRLVLEAARLAEKGTDVDQIIQQLNKMRERTHTYFMVDDLRNLQKGGRLSGSAALLGSMLKIKPILYFDDKEIKVFEKVRTEKKAIAKIEGLLEKNIAHVDYPLVATIVHANVDEKATTWKASLQEKFPTVRFEISYFGAVIGTHVGEGAIGMTWTEDMKRQTLGV